MRLTFPAKCLASIGAAAVMAATIPAAAQVSDKVLRTVRGTVGYQTGKDTDFHPVFGRISLPDDDYAVTRATSNASLVLPDSSDVAIGASTSVQIGAFNDATSPTPTTIALANGTLRFAIRHPVGGVANYRFTTTTSQIAVRGTIALVQSSPANGDVIVCLQCAPNDVLVTVTSTGQQIPLLTGQTLAVSPTGSAVVSPTTPASLVDFANAGLNPTAVGPTAFGAGIDGHLNGGAPIAGGIAAAAAAAAVGIAASNSSNSPSPTVGHPAAPAPTATPTVAPTVAPTLAPTGAPTVTPSSPAASPTPSTAPIGVITTGTRRSISPSATPAPASLQEAPALSTRGPAPAVHQH